MPAQTHELREVAGHERGDLGLEALENNLGAELHGVPALKGDLAGDDLEEDDSEAVHIGGAGVREVVLLQGLGRVPPGLEEPLAVCRRVEHHGGGVVGELEGKVFGDQDVGALEVPVGDLLVVQVADTLGKLHGELEGEALVHVEVRVVEEVVEGADGEELSEEADIRGGEAPGENRVNVGVVELPELGHVGLQLLELLGGDGLVDGLLDGNGVVAPLATIHLEVGARRAQQLLVGDGAMLDTPLDTGCGKRGGGKERKKNGMSKVCKRRGKDPGLHSAMNLARAKPAASSELRTRARQKVAFREEKEKFKEKSRTLDLDGRKGLARADGLVLEGGGKRVAGLLEGSLAVLVGGGDEGATVKEELTDLDAAPVARVVKRGVSVVVSNVDIGTLLHELQARRRSRFTKRLRQKKVREVGAPF